MPPWGRYQSLIPPCSFVLFKQLRAPGGRYTLLTTKTGSGAVLIGKRRTLHIFLSDVSVIHGTKRERASLQTN